ncbi:uncharacterized protein LOC105432196 [Pogonomyrmex barbatus]|uniref:Uncharacterized protein LOC105432196 n=1 Tax=Pogonomyrmex barbatus TaxID=144034 RepID=A0A6I9WS94_9HYME|nr:uncharacterized protein LOC105432196 [Pogonomyrmex barbatus]
MTHTRTLLWIIVFVILTLDIIPENMAITLNKRDSRSPNYLLPYVLIFICVLALIILIILIVICYNDQILRCISYSFDHLRNCLHRSFQCFHRNNSEPAEPSVRHETITRRVYFIEDN